MADDAAAKAAKQNEIWAAAQQTIPAHDRAFERAQAKAAKQKGGR